MKKAKVLLVLLSAVCLAEVSVQSAVEKDSGISIMTVEEEVVLYTIHRGSHAEIGRVMGELYSLAGDKALSIKGGAYCVYLNNPHQVSHKHWLTEIRIPVSEEALEIAGTLGEMTDIKKLPALTVAVAIKPEGQADSGPIYINLHTWIIKQGYVPVSSSREKFLTNVAADNYPMMKTEISIPIKKRPVSSD